ncbi:MULTISPECIES: cell division protein SepF [unclassified Sporolactobacillus]|uniref:cell division protein SepF n=1 Tax=unclassified Sporolactobacillus TaxID=2628533 RepID=UPI002368EDA2|nr:cell division protein SepF [Sporolactobacillus sp. CQH2019]MDD9147146.1 cell division protein SepF [Sporolactobacillus sp. CQH2019]
MGLKTTFRRFFDLEETVEPSDESAFYKNKDAVQIPAEKRTIEKGGRIVAIQNVRQRDKVVLVEPKSFEEVEGVVGHLKNKRTVICNLQSVTKAEGQRILDFMGGTVFALDGQIRKIGRDTFLFAPDFVDITGIINDWKEDGQSY